MEVLDLWEAEIEASLETKKRQSVAQADDMLAVVLEVLGPACEHQPVP